MKTYLLIFLLAAGSSLVFTPLVRRLCERLGWLDEIRDERRIHTKPVPRLGGIAIFSALVVSLGVLLLLDNLITQSLHGGGPRLLPIVLPATLIFLCGVYDDVMGMSARFKFAVQAVGGLLFYALGGRIEGLALPFWGTLALPSVVGCLLTVFWIVAVTNAFNLLDGLDGLAAGAALFASLILLVVSYQMGQPLITVFGLALCGSLAGFLRYNFNPASIFLGDSGSLLLGFLLAALSVQGAQKASTAVALTIPLVAFGLPIFDTLFALMRRFISGKPLFEGDREHFHHKLLERGWSHRRVVLSLYVVCALFGLSSLLFVSSSPMTGLFLVIIGVVVIIGVSGLRYHEVDEVGAGVRRNTGERRSRLANNVVVRRASQKMSYADSLEEIIAAFEVMLAHEQFAGVRLWLTPVDEDIPDWSWVRSDVTPEAIFDEARNWRLSLPLLSQIHGETGRIEFYRTVQDGNLLLDINLLCYRFAQETARAWARVSLPQKRKAATAATTLALAKKHSAGI